MSLQIGRVASSDPSEFASSDLSKITAAGKYNNETYGTVSNGGNNGGGSKSKSLLDLGNSGGVLSSLLTGGQSIKAMLKQILAMLKQLTGAQQNNKDNTSQSPSGDNGMQNAQQSDSGSLISQLVDLLKKMLSQLTGGLGGTSNNADNSDASGNNNGSSNASGGTDNANGNQQTGSGSMLLNLLDSIMQLTKLSALMSFLQGGSQSGGVNNGN